MFSKLLLAAVLLVFFPILCAASGSTATLPVIGEVETIELMKQEMHFLARIDTGAQTSSFSAVRIQPFERDGKRWIRFHITDPLTRKSVTLEKILERTVKIKRHGQVAAERPVVKLLVAIGDIRQECEFSLVDRSDYEFPVLIGRNFLSGKAIVDVNHRQLALPKNQGENKDK
ncbi:MAG: hypothetical protein DSY80_00050 [Desulfocapsa sp.]|nr:MAG: hypothetical protein DSY80_00050 [Desulfocapsa sp.]